MFICRCCVANKSHSLFTSFVNKIWLYQDWCGWIYEFLIKINRWQLFQAALDLQEPWQVNKVSLEPLLSGPQALTIQVSFARSSKFTGAHGQLCSVYDTEIRVLQHLNFFEHDCSIECAVPRITDSACKVVAVQVPWARPSSGFTLMFEAFAMSLIESEMPVSRVAKLLKVNLERVWIVLNHWVGQSVGGRPL